MDEEDVELSFASDSNDGESSALLPVKASSITHSENPTAALCVSKDTREGVAKVRNWMSGNDQWDGLILQQIQGIYQKIAIPSSFTPTSQGRIFRIRPIKNEIASMDKKEKGKRRAGVEFELIQLSFEGKNY